MSSSGRDPLRRLPLAVLLCDGEPLPLQVRVADTFFARLRGLLGIRLAPTTALYIRPCQSIHMWGMRVALDVVFVDAAGVVLRVCEAKPFQIKSEPRASAVLECAAGTAQRLHLAPGQRLVLAPPPSS